MVQLKAGTCLQATLPAILGACPMYQQTQATKHDQAKLPTLEEDYPTLQQAHSHHMS